MNPNKLKTLSFLKTLFSPLSKRVYIVGGCVRDNILGIDSDDIDIEVYDISIEQFTELMEQIGAIGVGKSFFVYKYEGIDISLPRTETKTGYGHQGFDVSYINDEKIASKRRDFTINALMQNIYTDEILDFYGGIEDLKSKTIRIIDEKTFVEDSLRVLRGIRFASKFGFKIEQKSFAIMQKISLDDLSKERISKEFELIFQTKYLEYGFFYLYKIGFLKKYFQIDIDTKTFFAIYRLLKTKKRFFYSGLYEYYMPYIINSFCKINFSILKSRKYEKLILKHPSLNFDISDRDLCIIALDMPILEWLGALSDDIIQRAKILDIYEDRLKTDVNPQDIINDGFVGSAIKSEYLMRNLKYIDDKITKRQQRRNNYG
jgi:tRNA nucleotidyltransferase (CCA-adding enzyme)